MAELNLSNGKKSTYQELIENIEKSILANIMEMELTSIEFIEFFKEYKKNDITNPNKFFTEFFKFTTANSQKSIKICAMPFRELTWLLLYLNTSSKEEMHIKISLLLQHILQQIDSPIEANSLLIHQELNKLNIIIHHKTLKTWLSNAVNQNPITINGYSKYYVLVTIIAIIATNYKINHDQYWSNLTNDIFTELRGNLILPDKDIFNTSILADSGVTNAPILTPLILVNFPAVINMIDIKLREKINTQTAYKVGRALQISLLYLISIFLITAKNSDINCIDVENNNPLQTIKPILDRVKNRRVLMDG